MPSEQLAGLKISPEAEPAWVTLTQVSSEHVPGALPPPEWDFSTSGVQ